MCVCVCVCVCLLAFELALYTLPEGEEDDGFDGDELEDRVEGREEGFGGRIEEKQAIESNSD